MNKFFSFVALLMFVSLASIGQNDIVLVPKSKASSKPLSRANYIALTTGKDITMFRWRQYILKSSQISKTKRDLVCFDSNDRVVWSYEYENIGAFSAGRNNVICSDSLKSGYLIDETFHDKSSKKNKDILMNVHRFTENGELVKKEIKYSDFNNSARTNYGRNDFGRIESAIVSKSGLLFVISAKGQAETISYICKLNNDFEFEIQEISSEFPFVLKPSSDNSSIRTVSLIGDTLILMHSFKDREANLKLRIFLYDVSNLEKAKVIDYSIKTSEFNELIRAVGSEFIVPREGYSTPDGIISFPDWLRVLSEGRYGEYGYGLTVATTKFSLNSYFVVNNISGGLIIYGFYGDNRGDLTERNIWYAILPLAENMGIEKEIMPSSLRIDGIEVKDSKSFVTTGTLDLIAIDNLLKFKYSMKKNGHTLGDKSNYKIYYSLFK